MNEISMSIGLFWFLVILAGIGSLMMGWKFCDLVSWIEKKVKK